MNLSFFTSWPALIAIMKLLGYGLPVATGNDLTAATPITAVYTEKIDTSARFVQTSAELNLEFSEAGNKQGRNVIFLHGYTDSRRSFDRIIPFLPDSVHAWFISQRGHGNSGKPRTGYSPENFADDLAGFMNRLGISSAVIVGHSMGGTVAQQFAISYPSRTEGLILISSFAGFRKNKALKEMTAYIRQMNDPVDSSFVSSFQRSTIVKSVPEEYLQTVIGESMKLPAYVWKGIANDLFASKFILKSKAIKVPTLLIRGAEDSFCTAKDQHQMLSRIEGSQLVTYPGVGHAMHWEEPVMFSTELKNFLHHHPAHK